MIFARVYSWSGGMKTTDENDERTFLLNKKLHFPAHAYLYDV